MISISAVSLLSVLMSIVAIYFVFSIIQKVYNEKHRKPWIYIGVASICLALSELLRFLYVGYQYILGTNAITEAIIYSFVFFSLSFLSYGLLLEHLILKYYKGKFVKMKFVPVQEGTRIGDLDINVNNGVSYLSSKKDTKELYEQFSKATKQGFEGFLISEENPKEIRRKFDLRKSPIAWITQIDKNISGDYLKDSLDENSDVVDPLQINNLISYIDNFLEQSSNPFILMDVNQLFKLNSFYIVAEFLKYVTTRANKFNSIVIVNLREGIIEKNKLAEIKSFLKELE